LKKVQELIDA
jgi:hypothetical protein